MIGVGIWIFKFFFIGLSPFSLLSIKKITENMSRIRAMTLPLGKLNTTSCGNFNIFLNGSGYGEDGEMLYG